MAYTPEQIQAGMRAALAAGDREAVADLRARLGEAYRGEVRPVSEEMGTGERLRAGIGQGMTNVGRAVGRLTGQVSGEQAAENRRMDADLLGTGAGRIGSMIGEAAATAPLGGLAGAAGKQAIGRLGGAAAGQFAGRMVPQAAMQGAAEGALMAQPGNRMQGAALGGAFGAAIPAAGRAIARPFTRGAVNPTAAAKMLMREGADLTPGQMNPSGMWGQIEEAATNLPGVGPMTAATRQRGLEGFQRAAAQRGAAPGARAGTVQEAFASFEPAYDVVKGYPVAPVLMRTAGGNVPLASAGNRPGLLVQAAMDRSVLAGNEARRNVAGWLENRLTALPGGGRGQLDSADLLKLRSEIRAAARDAADDDAVKLLRNAERRVTDVLDSQLPPDAMKHLRAVDQQYGQYKVLEDAARRAGDQPGGITSAQLSAAAKKADTTGAYARGERGPMGSIARAGRQVFDVKTPPTGARLATLGGLGYLLGPGGTAATVGGMGLASTFRGGRQFLGGQTAAQQTLRALTQQLRRGAGRAGRRAGRAEATALGAQVGDEFNQE
jgi:hypothetical protein